MAPPDPMEMEPGELCLDCGLCCTRAIFSYLKLDAEDRQRLRNAGRDDLAAEDRIEFDCPAHEGPACGIYNARPSICRAWECATMLRVRAGELALDDARSIVRNAVKLHRNFISFIPEGLGYSEAQSHVSDNACPEGLNSADFQKMRLASVALETFLDKHIRNENDNVIRRVSS